MFYLGEAFRRFFAGFCFVVLSVIIESHDAIDRVTSGQTNRYSF
jgi:hypothetical protein